MSKTSIRSLVFIALFSALFIMMSAISLKLGGNLVPISLQTLAVVLIGLFLTPRNAFLSILVVIILASFGLPLFSGNGGISYLTGATGGFIFSFPFCAFIISVIVGAYLRNYNNKRSSKLLNFIVFFIIFELFGSLLAYVPGIPWLMHVAHFSFSKAMAVGFYPFIIGDALKSFVGAIVAVSMTPYIVHIRTSMINNKTLF